MNADMTGYRRAAVALHALGEEDRRWVLAELPDADRSTLHAYLEELTSLGFSSGSAIEPTAIPNASASPEQPIEFIRDATAAEMFAILDNEPSSLVAQLLVVENWQWKSPFMQMCSPVRENRIRAAITHSNESAPARRQILIQAVGSRVKESRATMSPEAATRSGSEVLMGAVKQALSLFRRLVKSWKR